MMSVCPVHRGMEAFIRWIRGDKPLKSVCLGAGIGLRYFSLKKETMMMTDLKLELLSEWNIDAVRAIRGEDIPESWVDNANTLWELTQYGLEHHCIGHTYAVKKADDYIGIIFLGEAVSWETDPKEMKLKPFYPLMGFVSIPSIRIMVFAPLRWVSIKIIMEPRGFIRSITS